MGSVPFQKHKLLSGTEISALCQQLHMVVKAGLPIHYGISILREQAVDEKSHKLYSRIYTPMENGASLYAAISDMSCFPAYMVEMIHLGEETGRIEDVLESLVAYYNREHEIGTNIRHALVYPLVMTYCMIIVLSIIVSQIVPVFSNLYTKLIGELSGPALFLMKISNLMNKYYIVFTVLLILLITLGIFVSRNILGQSLFQGKNISMSIARSRFANCMHLALASGLDTERSLDLAKRLVNNPYMLDKIEKCELHIRHGETFVSALLHSGIFSKICSGLLLLGAKTGSMVDVMKQISLSYEEETDRRLHRIILILEPALIIILSAFIGLILFSFVMPLLKVLF